jgi:rare lipoprotein A
MNITVGFHARSLRRAIPFLGIFLSLLIVACASDKTTPPPPSKPGYPKPYRALGKWYQPLPHSVGFRQRGTASWYGRDFHGKRTSSGESYDMYAMTAAHKTLPLGTLVQVKNLANRRSVAVRINDRGPFVRGRIIDLSYAAADKIDMIGPGTAPVEIEAVAHPVAGRSGSTVVPVDYFSGNFTFQVGAFTDRRNAERLRQELEKGHQNAHITVFDRGDQIFYRVRVGRCASLEEAIAYEKRLIENGYPDTFTVAE